MARPWFGGPKDDGRADARDGLEANPPKSPGLLDELLCPKDHVAQMGKDVSDYMESYRTETLHQIALNTKK